MCKSQSHERLRLFLCTRNPNLLVFAYFFQAYLVKESLHRSVLRFAFAYPIMLHHSENEKSKSGTIGFCCRLHVFWVTQTPTAGLSETIICPHLFSGRLLPRMFQSCMSEKTMLMEVNLSTIFLMRGYDNSFLAMQRQFDGR